MKKTKFWLLGIILALIYSCSDDFETKEQSPQGLEISEAQSYFEKNATDLAPLTFSNPLSRSANLEMPELVPEWDKAIQSENEDYFITEIPLHSQSGVICTEQIIKDAEFLCENKILCQRRLVIARQKDGDATDMFVATLVPDSKKVESVEESFAGRVFYSELNGDFRKAVGYKNGELQESLLIGKAYGFAIQTQEGAPTGYSKLTFQEESTLRTATYSSGEGGGGGGWDPGWGGGGSGGGTGGGSIGGGSIGGGSIGGGGTGGGVGGGGYDADYERGLAIRAQAISDVENGRAQTVYVDKRYKLRDGAALVTNTYGIATSCFNFLNRMTRAQLSAFGYTAGILGLVASGYQTYMAFTDGEITGNDMLGAVSTAFTAASLVFAAFGLAPVAGVAGILGCVIGIVSTTIDMLGQSLLIKVPLENGHNVYVYIPSNIVSFA